MFDNSIGEFKFSDAMKMLKDNEIEVFSKKYKHGICLYRKDTNGNIYNVKTGKYNIESDDLFKCYKNSSLSEHLCVFKLFKVNTMTKFETVVFEELVELEADTVPTENDMKKMINIIAKYFGSYENFRKVKHNYMHMIKKI